MHTVIRVFPRPLALALASAAMCGCGGRASIGTRGDAAAAQSASTGAANDESSDAGSQTASGNTGGASGISVSGEAATGFSGSSGELGVTTDGIPDAQVYCRPPTVDAGGLPFVVDTFFVPTGRLGDAPAYPATPANPQIGTPAMPALSARVEILPSAVTSNDACTADGVGRSSPNAQGKCWKVVFIPFPKTIQSDGDGGTMVGAGPGVGWASVLWQYPPNNSGNLGGGFPIPLGANRVTFWTRGSVGGEEVNFALGEGQGVPCSDVSTTYLMNDPLGFVTLTNQWVQWSIDIAGLDYSTTDIIPGQGVGGYFGGVIVAFSFTIEDQTLPALDGSSAPPNETDPDGGPVLDYASMGTPFPPFFPSTITFYIDDIEWQ
jgi:hypothetical protein